MRFAYIDSQGNEVTIPSVDALALRIELGAIGPDTQLYDAQADRWGPAESHDIFHTLSRGKEEGFVAPPPPVPPPVQDEPPVAPVVEGAPADTEAPVSPSTADAPAAGGAVDVPAPEPEAGAAEEEEAPVFDLSGGILFEGGEEGEAAAVETTAEDSAAPADDLMGLDLTLSDGPAPAAPEPPAPAEAEAFDFGGDGLGFDLAPEAAPEAPPTPEPTVVPEATAPAAEPEEGGFDFGDLSGGLQLEGSAIDDDDVAGGGLELETPMGFAGGADDAAGGLELETPMSEFTPEAPPSWMEEDEPDEESLDFDRPAAAEPTRERPKPRPAAAADAGDAEDEDGAPIRPRAQPRSRPSPPRRKKQAPVGAIVGGIVAVAVLAGGGYFGLQFMQNRAAASADQPVGPPPVVIPDIPPELLPGMRDMAEVAVSSMLEDLRRRSADLDIPSEPNRDWLAGVYLANASRFEDIERFWLGIEQFVDTVRASDVRLFHAAYVAQLEAAGIVADTAELLSARADSGFVSARVERWEAYNRMDDLVNAALDLHQFLLVNEDAIDYEPAAGGISRDPVLEAVPSTKALGDQMWDMVDAITDALDQLGTLDRVTTERLFAVLFDRIRRAGIH